MNNTAYWALAFLSSHYPNVEGTLERLARDIESGTFNPEPFPIMEGIG